MIEGEKRIFEYNFFYSMISDEKQMLSKKLWSALSWFKFSELRRESEVNDFGFSDSMHGDSFFIILYYFNILKQR